jgi:hypothetical protein
VQLAVVEGQGAKIEKGAAFAVEVREIRVRPDEAGEVEIGECVVVVFPHCQKPRANAVDEVHFVDQLGIGRGRVGKLLAIDRQALV